MATFSYKDIIPQNLFAPNLTLTITKLRATEDCETLISLNHVHSNDSYQGSFIMSMDTRVLASRVLKQDSYLKIFSNFPVIEDSIKYLDHITDDCKKLWTQAYI